MLAACLALPNLPTRAEVILFFSAAQTTNLYATASTSDTISTEGYLFALTRDKLFTGGVGLTNPIGRNLRVHWPEGLEAQAVTTGPQTGGAKIVLKREDGDRFSVESLSFKLLANTFGAGASLEIMPMINGEDAFADPLMLDATGFGGMSFSYQTGTLTNFDEYKITLYVDLALTALTIVDSTIPRPSLDIYLVPPDLVELSWPAEALEYQLEKSLSLANPGWTTVTNEFAIENGRAFVGLKAAQSQQMFRMRK
ncbi:MAG: hypothetical protein ACXW3Z_01680 [Limisphaerales bacterium]